jgi:hypothetical protein
LKVAWRAKLTVGGRPPPAVPVMLLQWRLDSCLTAALDVRNRLRSPFCNWTIAALQNLP